MQEADLPLPSQGECNLASLPHFLQLVTWWIGPLVIYLVKRESRFVAFHALQALILQLFYFVAGLAFMFFWIAAMFGAAMMASAGDKGSKALPIAVPLVFFFMMLLWMAMWTLTLILGIVYGIKAGRRIPLLAVVPGDGQELRRRISPWPRAVHKRRLPLPPLIFASH